MNKNDILVQLEESREKFLDTLDGLPVDQWNIPGVEGEWSIKDILSHLERPNGTNDAQKPGKSRRSKKVVSVPEKPQLDLL